MLGTEKIEEIAEALKELTILSKKIAEDKKVDLADLSAVIAFLPKVGGIVSAVKALDEAIAEGKDLDIAEIVSLVQSIAAKIKEIEKA